MTGYTSIYGKKNFYTQNILDSEKVIIKTILLFKALLKSMNPLKMIIARSKYSQIRSSHPEVLLGKGVLKICLKYTGEQSCQSAISIKLLCNPCQSAISIKLFATLLKSHFGMGVLL